MNNALTCEYFETQKKVRKCIEHAFSVRKASIYEVPQEFLDRLENTAVELTYLTKPGPHPFYKPEFAHLTGEEWTDKIITDEKYLEDLRKWDEENTRYLCACDKYLGKIAGTLEIIFQYLCLHGTMEDNYTVETDESFVYASFKCLL